jgi:hypothetical protein
LLADARAILGVQGKAFPLLAATVELVEGIPPSRPNGVERRISRPPETAIMDRTAR